MLPTLSTARLLLRPFIATDASQVRDLAGDVRIAEQTLGIPHPYPVEAAEKWIAGHSTDFARGSEANFAMTLKDGGELLGAASLLAISAQHARAELGCWVGVDHWAQGYCTEAILRLIDYARLDYGLTRITARCLAGNIASARVLEKLGLRCEGRLTKHLFKNGCYQDMLLFALTFPERSTRSPES